MVVDKFNRGLFKVDLPKKQYLKYDGKHFFYCGDNKINVALNKNLLRINYNHNSGLEYSGKRFKPPGIIIFNPAGNSKRYLVASEGKIVPNKK